MQDVLERPDTTSERSAVARDQWTDAGVDTANEGHGLVAKVLMGTAAGAIGVWALDRVDWFMWNHQSEEARSRTTSVRPGGEPPAHVMVSKIEQMFDLTPTPEQHELAGLATHYGIGIAPAVVYALVRDKLPGEGPIRGLLYGLGLFVLQDEVVNSASGLAAKPQAYPWQAHARGLIAHLVYGVATETVLNLMEKSLKPR